MGDLQTYFYLALISVIMIGLTLLLIFVAVRGLYRWFRQSGDQPPVTFWLVGGAIALVLLFIVLGSAGVLYGFIRYGAS